MFVTSNAYSQKNMNLLGSLSYAEELSDIWGYADSLGNEYAIVGVYDGVSVVDITDPANPNEVWFFTGASSIWRDIKTWNQHAYVTNESNGGLFIIDLSNLPDTSSPATASYGGTTYTFTSAHNLYIDENGVAYLFGANYSSGGAIMLDLTVDPMVPVELGIYDDYYFHDGMARGDTLWGSHISNNGVQTIIDVSDKGNPTLLANWSTPNSFTHNCWISDDNNYIFTTDEKSGAYIASYDVSDINNVYELDRIQSNPGSGVIPHNTHYINGYVVTSYYRDGVTVHDVSRPANMIEVGNFDSYSQGSGDGFNGDWGAYPWLPSGNIIISDIENGLFILGPNYVRGCYLEGTITDQATGNAIVSATVDILSTSASATSNVIGDYATGLADSGSYQVIYDAAGYYPDTVITTLNNGVLTIVDVQLTAQASFTLSGQVVDASTGVPISNALVIIESINFTYNETTDAGGNFTIPTFFGGTYELAAGQWGYVTHCEAATIGSTTGALTIELDPGVYDDFTFDFGWAVSGNAAAGTWERGTPNGTSYNGETANPDADHQNDCGNQAYVTGNMENAGAGDDDVDDGNTILTSPMFNLIPFGDPYIEYSRWFFNDGGFNASNDTLFISISNGTQTELVEAITDSGGISGWKFFTFKVSDYINPASTMMLIIETADQQSSGHLTEAGFDFFRVTDSAAVGIDLTHIPVSKLMAFPNPFGDRVSIAYEMDPAINKGSVGLFDLAGRELLMEDLSQNTGIKRWDIGLGAGIYWVQLYGDGNLLRTIKIIRQ